MNLRGRIPVAGVLAGAGALLLAVPVAGLLVRAPWSALGDVLRDPGVRTSLRLSLVCSVLATVMAVLLGVPLAWVLARASIPGRQLLRALALVPLVLPPVVGGVALLLAFGRRGLVGQWLDSWFGVRLPFTTGGAVLAEAFVAMPFVVITAEAAFRNVDRRYEEAARSLGAGRWTVFRRIVVPLSWPPLVAGAVLGWARAIGEFGATITFAGNSPGRTTTVPLEVYLRLQSGGFDAAVVLSLVLLALSIAILVGLRDRWIGAL
jgi:molybdate transport system permease protein